MNVSANTGRRLPTATQSFEEAEGLSEKHSEGAASAAEKTAPKDYSDEMRYNRKRAVVTALLKWLECEFFGLFIFLSLLALRVVMKTAADIIFGLFGLVTYVMVMADFGIKEGNKAHIKNSVRGDNVKSGFGWVLGLVSIIPPMLSLALPGFAAKVPEGSAVAVFKALNAGLWGLINLFAPDMDITHVSPLLFAVYPVIQLVLAAVAAGAFRVGFTGDDLQTKLLYKKSK